MSALLTLVPDKGVLVLKTPLTNASTTATFTWKTGNVGPYTTSTAGVQSLVTSGMLNLSPRNADTGDSETVYVTGGVLNTAETEITYTLSKRGIPDGETAYPPTSELESLKKSHRANTSHAFFTKVLFLKVLESNYSASSKIETFTNNFGTFAAGKVASLRADGRYELGNGNVFGIYTNSGADGGTATVQTTGIITPVTVAGASIKDEVFADLSGKLTTTATNNTFVGIYNAVNSLSIRSRAEQDLEYDNSLLIDQNKMAYFNSKNIKNFGLDGSESWTDTGGSGTVSDDTDNIKVAGSIGKRNTATAVSGQNQALRYDFPSSVDLEVSDGDNELDSSSFFKFSLYISDDAKVSELKVYLVSTSGFIDSYRNTITTYTTGWNHFEILMSDFAVFNGTPDINAINDLLITFKPSDTSQPYITIDPATIQVVRTDPEVSTRPNPFQDEVSDGSFERILNAFSGKGTLLLESGKFCIASYDSYQLRTEKEWKSFSSGISVFTGFNSSISFPRIWRGTIGQGMYLVNDGTFRITGSDSSILSSKTITPTKNANFVFSKKASRMNAVLHSNENDIVSIEGFDSDNDVILPLWIVINDDDRLGSLKVTNTSAINEYKDEKKVNLLAKWDASGLVVPSLAIVDVPITDTEYNTIGSAVGEGYVVPRQCKVLIKNSTQFVNTSGVGMQIEIQKNGINLVDLPVTGAEYFAELNTGDVIGVVVVSVDASFSRTVNASQDGYITINEISK